MKQMQESSLSAVCEKVLDRCLAPSTLGGEGCDNMTMILVQFKKPIYHGNNASAGEQSAIEDKSASVDEQSALKDKNASSEGQLPGDIEQS
jgi:protein phosphatase 1G